jgi:hypothetical protein
MIYFFTDEGMTIYPKRIHSNTGTQDVVILIYVLRTFYSVSCLVLSSRLLLEVVGDKITRFSGCDELIALPPSISIINLWQWCNCSFGIWRDEVVVNTTKTRRRIPFLKR